MRKQTTLRNGGGTCLRPCRALTAVLLLVCLSVLVTAPAGATGIKRSPQQSYFYTGVWNGNSTNLTHVGNVTVEGLPDATLVGTIGSFDTDDPSFSCLNGESINVWTAPKEFPNEYVVHNGWQGSQCTYGTWTIPFPSYFDVTFAAWIPQTTLDGAPVLPWAAYAAIGLSCWTPPWWAAPLTVEYIVGNGDGHAGFSGTARAYTTVQIGWNGSSITSFTPLTPFVTLSTVTAYYAGPAGVNSCTLQKPGTQLSPTPRQTGPNSFSIGVAAQNNIAPPGLNPPLDGDLEATISGTTPGHATFSFSGYTELFPSYGVSVDGPSAYGTDVLFSAAGYGNPIGYPLVYTLLNCVACAWVSGNVSV
jgi:hypothetical protein